MKSTIIKVSAVFYGVMFVVIAVLVFITVLPTAASGAVEIGNNQDGYTEEYLSTVNHNYYKGSSGSIYSGVGGGGWGSGGYARTGAASGSSQSDAEMTSGANGSGTASSQSILVNGVSYTAADLARLRADAAQGQAAAQELLAEIIDAYSSDAQSTGSGTITTCLIWGCEGTGTDAAVSNNSYNYNYYSSGTASGSRGNTSSGYTGANSGSSAGASELYGTTITNQAGSYFNRNITDAISSGSALSAGINVAQNGAYDSISAWTSGLLQNTSSSVSEATAAIFSRAVNSGTSYSYDNNYGQQTGTNGATSAGNYSDRNYNGSAVAGFGQAIVNAAVSTAQRVLSGIAGWFSSSN